MMAKTLFCMECGAGMPATAAFCRQCGAAVPEEDLAKSKQEAAEWASAQLDAVIQLDVAQKKSRRSVPGPHGSGPADRHQLAALGLPSNLKWAALGVLIIAIAGSGGYALHRYVTHDDGGAHASAGDAAHSDHKADHGADEKVNHKADHSADHKADQKADHNADHKAEAGHKADADHKDQAHAPAPKASGH